MVGYGEAIPGRRPRCQYGGELVVSEKQQATRLVTRFHQKYLSARTSPPSLRQYKLENPLAHLTPCHPRTPPRHL